MYIPTNEERLELMRNQAAKRGGKLISTEWITTLTKYEFEDILGNRFFSLYRSIKKGSWKREGLITEPLCRQAMEHLFNDKFPTTQQVLTAKILNRTRPLELDGYCYNSKMAFEYQGHEAHWDKDHPKYLKVSQKDKIKKKYCKKLGILLVVIPAINETSGKWSSENILNHVLLAVRKTYRQHKKAIPSLNLLNFQVDLSKNNHAYKKMEELKEIARLNKGKLICTQYKGARDLHTFQFEDGREFQIIPDSLKRNGWPEDPDFFLKSSDERYSEFKEVIEKNEGTLLENQWNGCESKHLVLFKNGKKAYLIPESLRKCGWPKNIDKFSTTDEDKLKYLKDLAEENDGKLVDQEWKGYNAKYHFEFKNGKQFFTNVSTLKSYGWPDATSRTLKSAQDNLNILSDIAKAHHGKLLSTEWKTKKDKYQFQFKDGRKFEMMAQKLTSRGWPKNADNYIKMISDQNRTDEDRFAEIKKIAEDNGGKILETNWLAYNIKHKFQFADGREFSVVPSSLVNYGWPKKPDEYFNRSRSHKKDNKNYCTLISDADFYNEIRRIAERGHGKLLETSWLGHSNPHRFAFKDGREFSMTPLQLKKEKWPNNPDKFFYSIDLNTLSAEQMFEKMKKLAHQHNGNILEDKWLGNTIAHKFLHSNKKEFFITPDDLYETGWPKNQSGVFTTEQFYLNHFKNIASANGGRFISTELNGKLERHKFLWNDGREFKIRMTTLRNSGWPKDLDIFLRRSGDRDEENSRRLDEMHQIANENKGKFLDTEWVDAQNKHNFSFEDGRKFQIEHYRLKKYGWPKNPDLYFKLIKNTFGSKKSR